MLDWSGFLDWRGAVMRDWSGFLDWVNLHGLDWAPTVIGSVQIVLLLFAVLVAFLKLEDSAARAQEFEGKAGARAKIDRVVSLYSSYTAAGYATLRGLVDPKETAWVIEAFDRERNITDPRQRTSAQARELRSRIVERLIELLEGKKEAIFGVLGHYLAVVKCVNGCECDEQTAFNLYGNDMRDFSQFAGGVLEREAKAWSNKEIRDAPIVKFLVANGMTEKDFLCEYQRVLARESFSG